MRKIISDKILRIVKNRQKLEDALEVKITNRGKEVYIEGDGDDEYIAEKVIDAINFGFPINAALSIKKYDNIFERINIKDYTKRHDLESVRARIIGRSGRTLKTLSEISECYFEINMNEVAIIGAPEQIEAAQNAVISIIQGAKQTNVYAGLERSKKEPITDLGLKE